MPQSPFSLSHTRSCLSLFFYGSTSTHAAQLPCLLPRCFPSLNPRRQQSETLFPSNQTQKAQKSQSHYRRYLASHQRHQSKSHQIFHLSLSICYHGFVICGGCGLDCSCCGLWWRLWVMVEVVSCFVSLWVMFDGGSGLFHWVARGCGLWWGCLSLLR